MNGRLSWINKPRIALLLLSAGLLVTVAGGGDGFGMGVATGAIQTRERTASSVGTPVAASGEREDPLDGDPLDGEPDPAETDPLDGELTNDDADAPLDQSALAIVRSGRPSQEPRTLAAYDGDPATVWQPEAEQGETWIWLDLGGEQRVREVRWLALGAGAVAVQVSSDRQRWQEIDRVETDNDWQGVVLRDDARYVRLELLPDDGIPPAIAEVAVYGKDRSGVSLAQETDGEDERRRGRENRETDEAASPRGDAGSREAARDRDEGQSRRRGRGVQISAEPGETRCSGDRERCRARQGTVAVEDDCDGEGSCTIDIQVDGGTAVCDAGGGTDARAGDGEGRRNGDGGRCEAVANGGAVAIGDINP